MERKYQRQYENFTGVVPNPEDFPVLGKENGKKTPQKDSSPAHIASSSPFSNLKLDDILLVAVLILMITEEEKDMPTIIILAVLLLSEYL